MRPKYQRISSGCVMFKFRNPRPHNFHLSQHGKFCYFYFLFWFRNSMIWSHSRESPGPSSVWNLALCGGQPFVCVCVFFSFLQKLDDLKPFAREPESNDADEISVFVHKFLQMLDALRHKREQAKAKPKFPENPFYESDKKYPWESDMFEGQKDDDCECPCLYDLCCCFPAAKVAQRKRTRFATQCILRKAWHIVSAGIELLILLEKDTFKSIFFDFFLDWKPGFSSSVAKSRSYWTSDTMLGQAWSVIVSRISMASIRIEQAQWERIRSVSPPAILSSSLAGVNVTCYLSFSSSDKGRFMYTSMKPSRSRGWPYTRSAVFYVGLAQWRVCSFWAYVQGSYIPLIWHVFNSRILAIR